jgi:lambda repressor-like predicted transcriptional regulator
MSRDETAVDSGRSAGDEHRGLVARLEAISTDLGSRAALAKRAGIAPSSLQNYFHHSEPTRPVLIALARAAHVSITWLATGSRSQECGQSAGGLFRGRVLRPSPVWRSHTSAARPAFGIQNHEQVGF